jgi:hypothetical protein
MVGSSEDGFALDFVSYNTRDGNGCNFTMRVFFGGNWNHCLRLLPRGEPNDRLERGLHFDASAELLRLLR